MKAEELMIGDWVLKDMNYSEEDPMYTRPDYQPYQIQNGEDIDLACETNCIGDADVYLPIPLTTEILKKNKFRPVGERWGCDDEKLSFYYGNGQDIDLWLPSNSDKYMLVIRDHVSPDPEYQLILRFKFVHELQHALRGYKYEKITIKL